MAFSGRFSSNNPLTRELRGVADTGRTHRRIRELKAFVDTQKAHRLATFAGLHVFPDRIIKLPHFLGGMAGTEIEPDVQPVAGVSATVETTGGVSARATLTRSLLLSGWQKKSDDRATHLTVTGPGFTWTVPVPARDVAAARVFAAELSTHGAEQAGLR